jgi:putative protease
MPERMVGRVKEYFAKVGVAGIEITEGQLCVGDTIHIRGHTTDLSQQIDSMQIEHQPVQKAEPGHIIGIKVRERVRPNDQVFRVTE